MADGCLVDHHGCVPLRRALVYEREEPVSAQFSNDMTQKTNPCPVFSGGLGWGQVCWQRMGMTTPVEQRGVKE